MDDAAVKVLKVFRRRSNFVPWCVQKLAEFDRKARKQRDAM